MSESRTVAFQVGGVHMGALKITPGEDGSVTPSIVGWDPAALRDAYDRAASKACETGGCAHVAPKPADLTVAEAEAIMSAPSQEDFPPQKTFPGVHGEKATLSGRAPEEGHDRAGAPAPINPATGMHGDYWILSDAERSKGFVRPLRLAYKHLKCGVVTTMNTKLAETYAARPTFYGGTFCAGCRSHFPVGETGEFVWDGTSEKVGT